MSFMIFNLRTIKLRRGDVAGRCAHCGVVVYESLFALDDAYAVWAGRCPACNAINLLGTNGRGYTSSSMDLVLPTAEERDKNGLPADCVVRP